MGLDWRIDAANRLGVRAFSTRVHDLIDFAGGSTFEAINIAHAQIDGAELTHNLNSGAWSLDSQLTLQNPRNTDTGAQLLRRPKEKFSSVLTAALGERASAAWSSSGAASEDYASTTLGAYSLLNLRASYSLDASWQLGARL